MLVGFQRKLRSLVRLFLATTIWAHALFIFRVPQMSMERLLPRLHTSEGEFYVVILIILLSIMASYGWGKVTVDLIYIYFFPFIALFYAVRAAIRVCLKLNKFINGSESSSTISQDIPYYAQLSLPVLIPTSKRVDVPMVEASKEIAQNSSVASRLGRAFLRPFQQYTLLWCVLLLLTTHRWFIYLALGIVLYRLGDLVVGVVLLSFTANGWFTRLSDNINKVIDAHMQKITAAKDSAATQEAKNAWIALRGILMGVAYFRDRREVAQWTVFLGCIAFVLIYLYVSLLFSFTYYGIARLQNVVWNWSDALITAVFIPIAYTDLPHTKLLRLAGGIQWFCAATLGISTIVGFFKQQLEAFHSIAENIGRRFEQEDVRTTIVVVNEKLAAEGPKA